MSLSLAAVVTALFLVASFCTGTAFAKTRRDTYLQAYMESHGPSSLPPGEVYGSPYPAPVAPLAPEPHSAPDNPLDPVHGKLLLLFKVLLKLLVFKLIVKFIAIICVLLFLPKLSGLGLAKAAMDDDARAHHTGDRLDVMKFVLAALAGPPEFEDRCRDSQHARSDSALCRLRRAMRLVDQHTSMQRLFGVFLRNEEKGFKHKAS